MVVLLCQIPLFLKSKTGGNRKDFKLAIVITNKMLIYESISQKLSIMSLISLIFNLQLEPLFCFIDRGHISGITVVGLNKNYMPITCLIYKVQIFILNVLKLCNSLVICQDIQLIGRSLI